MSFVFIFYEFIVVFFVLSDVMVYLFRLLDVVMLIFEKLVLFNCFLVFLDK